MAAGRWRGACRPGVMGEDQEGSWLQKPLFGVRCFARWAPTRRAEHADPGAVRTAQHHGVKPPQQMHFNLFRNKGAKLAQQPAGPLRASHPASPAQPSQPPGVMQGQCGSASGSGQHPQIGASHGFPLHSGQRPQLGASHSFPLHSRGAGTAAALRHVPKLGASWGW